jgi:hypothetical protein
MVGWVVQVCWMRVGCEGIDLFVLGEEYCGVRGKMGRSS